MKNTRLAALVVRRSQDGSMLVLTTVPLQATVEDGDFTYTTPTCKPGKAGNMSDITEHVCKMLGIKRADFEKEIFLNKKYDLNGKHYKWFLLEVSDKASVTVNIDMVQSADWITPVTMPSCVDYMSNTRREMFDNVLLEAAKYIPELSSFSSEQVQMPMAASA